MVKYYSFVVFISVLLPKFLLKLMHKCTIHTTVNTAPEHGCRLDAGRVHGTWFTRTVNTVRFHGRVVCRVISKCPSNGKKIANMMSLQTGNKLSYTTEFVITYEKEKFKKVTVVGYHVCLYAIAEIRRTKTTTFLLDTQRDYASQ